MLVVKKSPVDYISINDTDIRNLPSWLSNASCNDIFYKINFSKDKYDYIVKCNGIISLETEEDFKKTYIFLPENFKDRFSIELKELSEKIKNLSTALEQWREGNSKIKSNCPYELLEKQLQVMIEYKNILEERNRLDNLLG